MSPATTGPIHLVRGPAKQADSCRDRLWRSCHQDLYGTEFAQEAIEACDRQVVACLLEDRNQSAAGSLAEGLDETLTLHRLGVYGVLGRSLKTTNGLESINALIEERCAKVDHWQNSSQRQRWLARRSWTSSRVYAR